VPTLPLRVRQTYATTLLRSVKRKVSLAGRIILAYRREREKHAMPARC
jgi:hypothetical protein